MASSDEEKSATEPIIAAQPQPSEAASASTAEAPTNSKKKGRPSKWGTIDITSEDAFKPSAPKNTVTMAALVSAKDKLKAEVRKATQLEKAAARRQSRLKTKAQNLTNEELIEIIQQRRQVLETATKKKRAAAATAEAEAAGGETKTAKTEAK